MNNGYSLDKAPNGEPSVLFARLLEYNNDNRQAAIQDKAKYTPIHLQRDMVIGQKERSLTNSLMQKENLSLVRNL